MDSISAESWPARVGNLDFTLRLSGSFTASLLWTPDGVGGMGICAVLHNACGR